MTRAARLGLGVLFAGAALATLVGRSFTALVPSPWDGQLFAYMGLEWLQGRIPYVHIWDNKPPGILALIALVFSVFPRSFLALAVAEGVFIFGCIVTVYKLLRLWGAPRPAAALATSAAAIAANLLVYNEQGTNTEIYLLWPAALSMYLFSKTAPRFRGVWLFLAGFCTGLAALFKPVGLAPFLAQGGFVLLLALLSRNWGLRQAVVSILVNGSGVVAAWLPFLAYFARHDAAGEMLDACLISPVKYGAAGQGSILFSAELLANNLQPVASLVAGALLGTAVVARKWADFRPKSEAMEGTAKAMFFFPLALFWVVFDLAGALAGGRGFPHYYLPLTVSLAVATGLAYWLLTEPLVGKPGSGAICVALFVLTLVPLGARQLLDFGEMLKLTVRRELPVVRPWKKMADQLNARRGPADTLFVWDYLPGIYWVTGMRSPTRQLFAFRIFHSAEFHRRFGEEILRELRASPPTFIVDGTSNQGMPSLAAQDSVYREFRAFVEGKYTRAEVIEDLKLYRLSPATERPME
jgi:hypothetical protein